MTFVVKKMMKKILKS